MAVYGLSAQGLRLGVLTLSSGDIRWFAVTPETPRLGRAIAWTSESALIAITRPDGSLPVFLRLGQQVQSRLPTLWDAAAAGGVSSRYVPSGENRDDRPHRIPSQLTRIHVDDGRLEPLASGEFFDFEVSPDGRHLAALHQAEDIQVGSLEAGTVGDPTRRRRLTLVDLRDGSVRAPLPDRDFLSHLLTWSPDGDRLLAFARRDDETFEEGRFWSIGADGEATAVPLGEAEPWIERSEQFIPIAYGGWSGRVPVIQVRTPGGERVWLSGGRTLPASPADRLVFLDGEAAIRRPDGLYAFPGGERIAAGRLAATGAGFDAGDRAVRNRADHAPDLVLIDAAGCPRPADRPGSPAVCPTTPPEDERFDLVSPDGRYGVDRRRSAGGATRLVLHDRTGEREVVEINTRLERLAFGDIREIRSQGPDGQALSSWLLMPADLPEAARPPVVVMMYPGDVHRAAPGWLQPGSDRRHMNPQVFASAGYAVLVPSLPEPAPGRRDRDDLADQLIAIIDAAGAQADVDTDRVALMGHSFGAYGALLAATQSERFSAVIAMNGHADLSRSAELNLPLRLSPEDGVQIRGLWGWAEGGQVAMGTSFPDRPLDYVERSPLYAARRLTAPTLLIASDLDGARLDALFSTLYRMDRNAAMLTYYGEGHSLVSPGNLRDLHGRIIDWLDRWLARPDTRQAALPAADPGFQNGENEEPIAPGIADQAGLP
jgi:dipeptidyl aminopeptidase/acylaminoacyl peptidase